MDGRAWRATVHGVIKSWARLKHYIFVSIRIPLGLAVLFNILKNNFHLRMRTELSSGFSSCGNVLGYLWHLNSNILWLVKTLEAVISGKGGIEEINLKQGNSNGLQHGFSFLFR